MRHVWTRSLAALVFGGISVLATITPAASEDTSTQFTLTGGSLGISVPSSADLGTTSVDSVTLVGSLGNVTVTDNRAALTATWTAGVASSDFTTGGGSANETVTKASLLYTTGVPSATSGTGAFTPTGGSLAAAAIAGAWLGTGSSSVTWNPTVTVTIAPGKVAGTYTGTITHSVA